MLLNPKAPPDAIAYSRDQGNICVGFGAAESFVELLRLVPTVEHTLRVSSKEIKERDEEAQGDPEAGADAGEAMPKPATQKRSQAGQETRWWQIVQTHWPGKWGSWAEFDRCKIVYRKLDRLKILDSYFDYAERFGEFHLKDISNKDILKVMWAILREMDYDRWADAILELLKMSLPTSDDCGWHLKNCTADLSKLGNLKVKMAESRLFKNNVQAATMRIIAPPVAPAQDKAKGRAKRAAKAKPGPKGPDPTIQQTSYNGRQTCFLDDLLLLIASVCREASPEKVASKKDIIAKLLRVGILFGMKCEDKNDSFCVTLALEDDKDSKDEGDKKKTQQYSKYGGPPA